MNYTLNPFEKETIINFSDANGTAEIYSCNKRWMQRMDALCERAPEQVKKIKSDSVSATYSFPKKWLRIQMPPAISDEQRARLADRAREIFGHPRAETDKKQNEDA